jgi:thiamine biosynthesis protein ThiI
MRCAIIHYHELALKGRNRDFFERQLIGNIRSALKGLGAARVESLRGRLRVVLPDHLSDHTVKARLSAVFGIANFSLARGVPLNLHSPNLEELTRGIGAAVTQRAFDTFRVSAKRADKRLTLTSMDVERAVGKYLCDLTGKTVKLTAPDLTIYIELLAKDAYYYLEKIQGPGVTRGRQRNSGLFDFGKHRFTGAAYRMMKQCSASFVHRTPACESGIRRVRNWCKSWRVMLSKLHRPVQQISVRRGGSAFRLSRRALSPADGSYRRRACWPTAVGPS